MLSWVIVMKRRIFITNTIVVVLALVALLLISSEVIRRVSDHYTSQAPPEEDPGAAQAAELLESWEDSGGWQELNLQLEALGYQLYVVRDGAEVFSSLSPLQSDLLRHGGIPASWPEGEAAEMWNGAALLVGIQSGGYTLVAMSRPDLPEFFGQQRPQAEASLLSLLIIGAAAILLIVSLSLISTHFQVKHIMRPVNALADAARRVEAGDYTRPVGYGGQDEFTAVFTAFDHMQEHLLAEREKNAAYERARTDLVAGISHDLRTPLTSVKGYLKGLRDGVANTPEKQRQYVDIAYRKACDMDVLLQRLFYFSKMETGALPIFLERADLGEFVRKFAVEAGRELAEKGGTVEVRGAPAPHPVRIDTEQMIRVLSNLTSNAVRYAGAEPLALTLTVWRERDRERLRFADNGQGVPEDQLPHLFEQFWRGDQARTSRGGEGSGLGLYIVKYIIEAHGGTVTARNDHGLVFEIALPCDEEGL